MAKEVTSDHDVLIRLDAKVDDLKAQVGDLKSDLIARVTKLEAWKDTQDVYGAQFNDAPALAQYIRSFRSNLKLIASIGLPIYALAIAVLTRLLAKWFGF